MGCWVKATTVLGSMVVVFGCFQEGCFLSRGIEGGGEEMTVQGARGAGVRIKVKNSHARRGREGREGRVSN